MVTQLGFVKSLGQVAWSSGGGQSFLGQQMGQPSDFSAETADQIDREVKALVERAYRRAKDCLQVREREREALWRGLMRGSAAGVWV